MDYTFVAVPKGGYLHVRIRGDNDLSTHHQYVDDIVKACVDHRCAIVLIEEDLVGERLPIGDIYHILAEKVEKIRTTVRVAAFVDVSPGRSVSNLEFGQNVAVNRGVTIRAFDTVKAAGEWLREQIDAGA